MIAGARVFVLILDRDGATVLAPARYLGPARRPGVVRACIDDGAPGVGPLFREREVARYHVSPRA